MSPTSTPRPCPRHEWHQAAQTATSTRAANCYGRQNTEPFSAGTYGNEVRRWPLSWINPDKRSFPKTERLLPTQKEGWAAWPWHVSPRARCGMRSLARRLA